MGIRKRRSKRVMSAAALIATLTWHDLNFGWHAGRTIFRAYGKPDSLFRDKFCYILRVYFGKNSVTYVQLACFPSLLSTKLPITLALIKELQQIWR